MKVEKVGTPLLINEQQYKITFYKTVKDIDGDDVQIVDHEEFWTLKDYEAQRNKIADRLEEFDKIIIIMKAL